MRGCNGKNELETTEFSKPLPVIGYYVVAASLLCFGLMFRDVVYGFRKRKSWFPCKWFSLNAFTITVLTVAAKFTVDLYTPMPGRFDQLSKLSGTVLICTATCNFIPSLGNMGRSELASNVAALAILVITVVVNICIGMRTGVIYVFLPEHIVVVMLMLVVLGILTASAFAVPATKKILSDKYKRGYRQVQRETFPPYVIYDNEQEKTLFELRRYWLLAHTSSPQYVLGRSATCIASGAFCLLGVVVLTVAFARSMRHGSMFCSGHSDYGWPTTILVFSVQGLAIVAGAIGPVFRWFPFFIWRTNGNPWRFIGREKNFVEAYWTKELTDWKEKVLTFNNESWYWRICKYNCKAVISWLGIVILRLIVGFSKLVWSVSISKVGFNKILSWFWNSANHDESIRRLENHVLHLDGEEVLVRIIIRRVLKHVDDWMDEGKQNIPWNLGRFMITGIQVSLLEVDEQHVPSNEVLKEEPFNCWAMPIVTLVGIAMALPGVDREQKLSLIEAVYQGLRYVRYVDKHLGLGDARKRGRKAADNLWKILDVNRGKVPTVTYTIAALANFQRDGLLYNTLSFEEAKERLTGDDLAMYYMCKMARSIPAEVENVLAWIENAVRQIIRMCLTNMPVAMRIACTKGRIEKRENRAREAVLLLGELDAIIVSHSLQLFASQELIQACHSRTRRTLNLGYMKNWPRLIRRISGARQDPIDGRLETTEADPSSSSRNAAFVSLQIDAAANV